MLILRETRWEISSKLRRLQRDTLVLPRSRRKTVENVYFENVYFMTENVRKFALAPCLASIAVGKCCSSVFDRAEVSYEHTRIVRVYWEVYSHRQLKPRNKAINDLLMVHFG